MKKFIALLAAAAVIFSFAACGSQPGDATTTATPADTTAAGKQVVYEEAGAGATEFVFVAMLQDETRYFKVKTDKTSLGEALQDAGLIAGEKTQAGLMVSTVCGVTLDYNADHAYWALYAGGAYADRGVEQYEITPGAEYRFEYTPNP
ncbi:MAG: DUF4430 domain-containing protein [Oscillospiraceae bacterium]|jgi:predicted small lipoprotein YifL|nr:DUF4430 domain-containing protein [Oscillospiraceae bacterium]